MLLPGRWFSVNGEIMLLHWIFSVSTLCQASCILGPPKRRSMRIMLPQDHASQESTLPGFKSCVCGQTTAASARVLPQHMVCWCDWLKFAHAGDRRFIQSPAEYSLKAPAFFHRVSTDDYSGGSVTICDTSSWLAVTECLMWPLNRLTPPSGSLQKV